MEGYPVNGLLKLSSLIDRLTELVGKSIIWLVLVPAEMLGVSAGLGYFILDARDRLAYSDLMAAILVIGFLGYLLDHAARTLHKRWLHAA